MSVFLPKAQSHNVIFFKCFPSLKHNLPSFITVTSYGIDLSLIVMSQPRTIMSAGGSYMMQLYNSCNGISAAVLAWLAASSMIFLISTSVFCKK